MFGIILNINIAYKANNIPTNGPSNVLLAREKTVPSEEENKTAEMQHILAILLEVILQVIHFLCKPLNKSSSQSFQISMQVDMLLHFI